MKRNCFCFLSFDAAKHVIASGAILKSVHLKPFRVTCVAHVLRNCAMKVKFQFDVVDQLIALVKSVTIKTETR